MSKDAPVIYVDVEDTVRLFGSKQVPLCRSRCRSKRMYYASLDAADPALPVECKLVRELRDPERPNIRFAMIDLSHRTKYLPQEVVIAPKSGFDVTLRGDDDAIFVHAFSPGNDDPQGYSLQRLWEQGVKDWGVITLTLEKAKEYQVVR